MSERVVELVILALVVACVTWTLTHEEIVREPREWLADKSKTAARWWTRKFYFMWTCEFCLSHYVSAVVILVMGFWLITDDWRGTVVALFAMVALANVFMSAFAKLRVELNEGRVELERAKEFQSTDRAPRQSTHANGSRH